jgi:hypothetical protein
LWGGQFVPGRAFFPAKALAIFRYEGDRFDLISFLSFHKVGLRRGASHRSGRLREGLLRLGPPPQFGARLEAPAVPPLEGRQGAHHLARAALVGVAQGAAAVRRPAGAQHLAPLLSFDAASSVPASWPDSLAERDAPDQSSRALQSEHFRCDSVISRPIQNSGKQNTSSRAKVIHPACEISVVV